MMVRFGREYRPRTIWLRLREVVRGVGIMELMGNYRKEQITRIVDKLVEMERTMEDGDKDENIPNMTRPDGTVGNRHEEGWNEEHNNNSVKSEGG